MKLTDLEFDADDLHLALEGLERVLDEAEADARVAEVEDALAVAVAAAASPVPIMSLPPVAPQSAEKIDGGQIRGHFSRTCVFCPF